MPATEIARRTSAVDMKHSGTGVRADPERRHGRRAPRADAPVEAEHDVRSRHAFGGGRGHPTASPSRSSARSYEAQFISPSLARGRAGARSDHPSGRFGAEQRFSASRHGPVRLSHSEPDGARTDEQPRRLHDGGRGRRGKPGHPGRRAVVREPERHLPRRRRSEAIPERPSARDTASIAEKRGDLIYTYLIGDVYKGIALHEVGHALGMLHNFASSYDAVNYMPQYWQLRTNEGKAMKSCNGTRAAGRRRLVHGAQVPRSRDGRRARASRRAAPGHQLLREHVDDGVPERALLRELGARHVRRR